MVRKIEVKDTRFIFRTPNFWGYINSFDNSIKVELSFPVEKINTLRNIILRGLVQVNIADLDEFLDNCILNNSKYTQVLVLLFTNRNIFQGEPIKNIYSLNFDVINYLLKDDFKYCEL